MIIKSLQRKFGEISVLIGTVIFVRCKYYWFWEEIEISKFFSSTFFQIDILNLDVCNVTCIWWINCDYFYFLLFHPKSFHHKHPCVRLAIPNGTSLKTKSATGGWQRTKISSPPRPLPCTSFAYSVCISYCRIIKISVAHPFALVNDMLVGWLAGVVGHLKIPSHSFIVLTFGSTTFQYGPSSSQCNAIQMNIIVKLRWEKKKKRHVFIH